MRQMVLQYEHERIREDCEAKEEFMVLAPELQDGFYVPQPVRCMWCDVDARLVGKMLVERVPLPPLLEESAKQARQRNEDHNDDVLVGIDSTADRIVGVRTRREGENIRVEETWEHNHGPESTCGTECPCYGTDHQMFLRWPTGHDHPDFVSCTPACPLFRNGGEQGTSKIDQYRSVRKELLKRELEIRGGAEFAKVPTGDGTPLSRKMFVETFCVAQSRIGNSPYDEDRKEEHIARLQVLIDIFQEGGEE